MRVIVFSLILSPALEERLSKQQKETEIERQLLQVLVGKLEAHLSQQSRLMEGERWALQQETTRLRAREQALEQERITSLAKLEDERRALAETKVCNNLVCNIVILFSS